MEYRPPFTINDTIIHLTTEIVEYVTRLSLTDVKGINPKLRRDNRMKTIQASLAIENNSLSIEQVTAIINGKRVLGPAQEVKEVQNAYEAYELLLEYNPFDITSLLQAHKILMDNLTTEVGMFRTKGVGVFAGSNLVHMAPPAKFVPEQVESLLKWAKETTLHPLIMSCVFHYEFEFIHPFSDGNGRMGRMWQTLLLYKWKKLFAWLPVETLIKERQTEYYDVLGECDRLADSSEFVVFMLNAIRDSLEEIINTEQVTEQVTDQVKKLMDVIGLKAMSARELMALVHIKHRPTFQKNYLLPAMELGLIEMTIPEKPNSSKQKYKKIMN